MVAKVTHRVHPYASLQLEQTYDFGDIRRATSREWHTDYLIDICPCDMERKTNRPWDVYDEGKLDLLAGTNGQVTSLPLIIPLPYLHSQRQETGSVVPLYFANFLTD